MEKTISRKLMLGLLGMVIGTSFANSNNISPSAMTKNSVSSSTSIVVQKTSPSFVIRIASNPTTGYSWKVKNYNPRFFNLKSKKFVTSQTKLMGAPGYQQFNFIAKPAAFTAKKPSPITFVYQRPWEKKSVKTAVYLIQTS